MLGRSASLGAGFGALALLSGACGTGAPPDPTLEGGVSVPNGDAAPSGTAAGGSLTAGAANSSGSVASASGGAAASAGGAVVGGIAGALPGAGSTGAMATGGGAGEGAGSGGSAPSADAGDAAREPVPESGRLYYLDIGGGRVLSARPDGSDIQVIDSRSSSLPDGIAVDPTRGHVYWTNMGVPAADDGFINRTALDGSDLTVPIARGQTFTPKQLKLDAVNGKLYWADREGMRIQRANLDGTQLETLVETGSGSAARRNAANWCVGIALDVPGQKVYWTQKGGDNAGVGSIRRAGLEVPPGEDPAQRSDIEVLYDELPEPIDLDLDPSSRLLYWTDRGDPPLGNSVNRAPMDLPPPGTPPVEPQVLVTGLDEAIGITLDLVRGDLYFTDLGGTVYAATLDGGRQRVVVSGQGSLTGIQYVAGN